MLDVVMIGIFVVLVASMVSLASWSDKVVKEGSNHDDCFIGYCCSNYGVLSLCIIKSGKVLIRRSHSLRSGLQSLLQCYCLFLWQSQREFI